MNDPKENCNKSFLENMKINEATILVSPVLKYRNIVFLLYLLHKIR